MDSHTVHMKKMAPWFVILSVKKVLPIIWPTIHHSPATQRALEGGQMQMISLFVLVSQINPCHAE